MKKFTLIELLVCIAILAIVGSLVFGGIKQAFGEKSSSSEEYQEAVRAAMPVVEKPKQPAELVIVETGTTSDGRKMVVAENPVTKERTTIVEPKTAEKAQ
jgi:prepilin-type N-terminal cleavage/methylation domain-containing protein